MTTDQVELKYLIDKLIESGEKNLDLQGSTLKALHELRTVIGDNSRDHVDIKSKLEEICIAAGGTLDKLEVMEHKGIIHTIESLKSCQDDMTSKIGDIDVKITEVKQIYSQVRTLLFILTGLVTVIGIVFSVLKTVFP